MEKGKEKLPEGLLHPIHTDEPFMIGDIRVEGLIRAAYCYIQKNDRMFSQK